MSRIRCTAAVSCTWCRENCYPDGLPPVRAEPCPRNCSPRLHPQNQAAAEEARSELKKCAARGFGAPVLALCGLSGSGKTLGCWRRPSRRWCSEGMAVAVVKHTSHEVEVDRPGKDSEGRISGTRGPPFHCVGARTGSSVARRPCPWRSRWRGWRGDRDLFWWKGTRTRHLPEEPSSAMPDGLAAAEGVTGIVSALVCNHDRLAALLNYLDHWLPLAWNARPLSCGLLIGGSSVRMGRPKQAVRLRGRALGEIGGSLAMPASATAGPSVARTRRAAGRWQSRGAGRGALPPSTQNVDTVAGCARVCRSGSGNDRGASLGARGGLDRGGLRSSMAARPACRVARRATATGTVGGGSPAARWPSLSHAGAVRTAGAGGHGAAGPR